MAKWTSLPLDFPLQYNPYQDAFWKAQKSRLCRACEIEFEAVSSDKCPQCDKKGVRKFHRLTLIAGRRGGKTRAASIAAVQEAMIPNTIGWCCAPTVPKLERYVKPALQQLIPESWVASYNSEFGDIRLKNGSLIHLQTLEDPDQGRGQGLDWLWVDEVSELQEEHWHVLRPSLTERRGGAFFSTSPRSYDWVYDQLYKPAEDGLAGYWACRYSTSENPIITAEEIDEARATMPDTMFRQEYEADFVTFTGAVYGEVLKPSQHFLTTDEQIRGFIPEWPQIHSSRPILIGIDTGADHPFGVVKIVSTEKGFVVVDEYLYKGGKPFAEHASAILRMVGNSPNVRYAINKNDKQSALELAQHKIFCAKAENDVVAGTERVKTWIHINKLFFAQAYCPLTVREMQAYRWADNVAADGTARKEKVFKKRDELCDAIRYALMTWPQLPRPEAPQDVKRDISKLPQEMQDTIQHMRQLNEAEEAAEKPAKSTTGDMWLSSLDDPLDSPYGDG